MIDSDSTTSSERGDTTEVDDCDFLEFLGDWSESIMFEGVADEIDYGEQPNMRFKEESASFKKRRLDESSSTMRLNSNTFLMKISAGAKAPPSSSSSSSSSSLSSVRKPSKVGGIRHSLASSHIDTSIRSSEDLKVEAIPENIYQAFNGGNLKLVSQILAASFSPDCLFQTMLMEEPLIGRQVRHEECSFQFYY